MQPPAHIKFDGSMGNASPFRTTEMGAAELARRIRAGEVSVRQVVEDHIRRIRETGELNAVVVPLFAQALAAADAADDAQARGQTLGPLHGVPVTIKEQLNVAGTPTTLGLVPELSWRAERDGPLVARLRRAGAIILGKTNLAQFVVYPESDNPAYGKTLNPWDPARSPGGSSGGEAAIIAAGGSPLGLGLDLGGSLRVPAHFTGIHTLTPTAGRLTNEGNRSELFEGGQTVIVPQPGPLARRVEDLRLAMHVLASETERLPDEIAPEPWPEGEVRLKDLRIGYYLDNGYFPASPAIRRAVQQAAGVLRARGVSVEPLPAPRVAEAMRLFLALVAGKPAPYLRAARRGPIDPRMDDMVKLMKLPRLLRPLATRMIAKRGQVRMAAAVRSMGVWARYGTLVRELEGYRRRSLAELESRRIDAILCPPFAVPAFTHGASRFLFSALSYTLLYNVLGWPAGVVAASRVHPGEESDRAPSKDLADRTAAEVEHGSAGLPVGVQVAARPWREDVVLAVMAALEEAFSRSPDYPLRRAPTPVAEAAS